MLNHQGHISSMEHAIGGPPDSRLSLWEVYNQAGRTLFMEHPWNWRSVGPIQIALPSTPQDYIDLPLDFGNIVHITVNNAAFRVNQTDLRNLMEMRRGRIINTTGGVWVCLDGNAPYVPTQAGTSKRLAVYPPIPNGVAYFNIAYQMCWREADADHAAHFPNVPAILDAALDYKARALARNLIKQSSTIEEQMYAMQIEVAKKEDALRQVDYGPLRGGADDFAATGRYAQGYSGVGFSNAPTN